MMRLALAFVIGCLVSTSALAQSVEVRSGRHDDFVRLIVDLPSRTETAVENGRDAATVTFQNKSLTFDTSKVFRRISRDVVADVVANVEGGHLEIKFGCECEVTSFWHGQSLLVLDVRTREELFEEAVIEEPEVESTGRILSVPQGPSSLAASLAKPRLKPEQKPEPAPADAQKQTPTPHPDAENELIREAREQLIRQLSRAASQGLISAKSKRQDFKTNDSEETESDTTPPALQPGDEPQIHPGAHVNLRAQSTIDRDFLTAIQEGSGAQPQSVCLTGQEIDVGNWASTSSFSEQIGALRQGLMGEFDRLNEEAVIQLARFYIHYGFGAEARDTLALIQDGTDEAAVLHQLAAIMEDGHVSLTSSLSGQLNCDGPAALWAVLSHQALPKNLPVNAKGAILAFDALPKHLRSHLGPKLSRRFLDADDKVSADKVLRILSRSDETSLPGAELVGAEIDRADGQYPTAIRGMESVVSSNSEPSAEALIQLIDTSIQSDTSISFEYVVLAGAYVQQYRGGPLEQDLARVYLIGLAASGAFDQSFRERERLVEIFDAEGLTNVDEELLNQLVSNADDVTFLKHVMANSQSDKTLSADIANKSADRLIQIGFPERARPLVSADAAGKAGRERQLLRAEISLLEGKPRQAEVDLLALEGQEADLLRARAKSQYGDHSDAARMYASAGDTDQFLRQSWLAEDWDQLLLTNDRVLSDGAALASLESSEDQQDSQEGRILTHNRGLIQKSAAARDTIEEILLANPSPEGAASDP